MGSPWNHVNYSSCSGIATDESFRLATSRSGYLLEYTLNHWRWQSPSAGEVACAVPSGALQESARSKYGQYRCCCEVGAKHLGNGVGQYKAVGYQPGQTASGPQRCRFHCAFRQQPDRHPQIWRTSHHRRLFQGRCGGSAERVGVRRPGWFSLAGQLRRALHRLYLFGSLDRR